MNSCYSGWNQQQASCWDFIFLMYLHNWSVLKPVFSLENWFYKKMSSFTDSERHPSLMGLGGFWHDKTEQSSALPIFWVRYSRSLPQTTKIISITRFIIQFHVFDWKQKASMFIKIECNQTGNSSCYLRNGGGWGLSTALLFRQLHFISISLYNVLLASSISSPSLNGI